MPTEGSQRYTEVIRVTSQAEARTALAAPGARIVIVERGYPRSVSFACPCGCGDVLVINVDRSVGKAWRLRADDRGVTLMPSVSRSSGCLSHFVLWENHVWWCRFDDDSLDETWPNEMDAELRAEWHRLRREPHS
jgi:hypothetical protein